MHLNFPISWPSDWGQANQNVFSRILCKQFSQLSSSGNDFIEAVRFESANDLGMLFSFWNQAHPSQFSPF